MTVSLTSGCVRLRVQIVDDSMLPAGTSGTYDLDSGSLRIAQSASATSRPIVAAEAVLNGHLANAPFDVDKRALARFLAAPVVQMMREVEAAKGLYAFMRIGEVQGDSQFRGMINGSERSDRDCPGCGDRMGGGMVDWRVIQHRGTPVAEIICDCEWCGPMRYLESVNAAGRPSMAMIQEVEPRPLTKEERDQWAANRKGVAGVIYRD